MGVKQLPLNEKKICKNLDRSTSRSWYERKEVVGDALCYSQPSITTNNHQNGLPVSPSTHVPAL